MARYTLPADTEYPRDLRHGLTPAVQPDRLDSLKQEVRPGASLGPWRGAATPRMVAALYVEPTGLPSPLA